MVKTKKRVLRNIIIALFVLLIISFAATKIIYDSLFQRYEDGEINESYKALSASGSVKKFISGENELTARLFDGEKDALVIIAVGFDSSAEDYLPVTERFLQAGYGVFIFDTTGSCESEGDSAIGFSQELLDLENALDYIEDNGDFGYKSKLLFGHSRGGYAVGCALGKDRDIDAAVTVAGCNSAMEQISYSASRYVGFLAYGNYPMLWLYQTMIFGSDTVNADASENIKNSDVPTLIIQGASDETVSPDGCSIYAHKDDFYAENAEYMLYEKAGLDGHESIIFGDDGLNEEIIDKAIEFYSKHSGKR